MSKIKFGITLPYGDARLVAELAHDAEEAGWDGVFVGDAIWCVDPLIQLTAAAMMTSRIRLGTMVLAMPLRKPTHVASESMAIDRLSQGRLILGLGTGATWMGWQAFPDEIIDTKERAEMLDEAIDIITRLHQSEQFDYDGKHYHIKLTQLDTVHYPPKTIQQPRVPIWIPGVWPRKKSMKRVLKCDGLLPFKMSPEGKPISMPTEHWPLPLITWSRARQITWTGTRRGIRSCPGLRLESRGGSRGYGVFQMKKSKDALSKGRPIYKGSG